MKMTMEDLHKLAVECLGITREKWNSLLETLKDDPAMNQVMRSEWHAKSRESEGAIREYYRSSEIWFANTFNHGVGGLMYLVDRLAHEPARNGRHTPEGSWFHKFLGVSRGRRFLDYGGGFFKDSWPLILSDYHITQAEVRGPVTSFLKIFLERAGLDRFASILPVDTDVPIHEQYDGIMCFETMEHVLKPLELTRHLVNHLHPGCPMAISVSFGATSHAPYHVASNGYLGNRELWASHLEGMGLVKAWEEVDGHRQIWRKK